MCGEQADAKVGAEKGDLARKPPGRQVWHPPPDRMLSSIEIIPTPCWYFGVSLLGTTCVVHLEKNPTIADHYGQRLYLVGAEQGRLSTGTPTELVNSHD